MKYRCTIHNLDFELQGGVTDCPLCMQSELNTLRCEYKVVKEQLKTLVNAMSIVKTIQAIDS